MSVDLRTLKAGDSVIYGKSGGKCLVNKIKVIDAFKFIVFLFNRKNNIHTSYQYLSNGENVNGGSDIVEIIPNPRRWTDDDMKAAFNRDGWQFFEKWLADYKQQKGIEQ